MDVDTSDGLFVNHHLSVIVPAFNEAASIEAILQALRHVLPDAEIIVVDDGSTDGTAKIADELADSLNVLVCHLEENAGKGAAVKHGLALTTRNWVVIQDADREYGPNDLLVLLRTAQEQDLPVVYGSRYKVRGCSRRGPWLNYFGVQLLAILEWLLYGQWLSDPHTCYKMLRRDVFQALDIQSTGFELCAEINSKLLRSGVSIPEVPIRYAARTVAAGKKIRLRDFFIAVWTYIRYRIGSTPVAKIASERETSKPNMPYLVTRILIGCLLLVAGVSKLSPLNAMAIATWLVIPQTVVFAWGVLEFLLGWACLTLAPHRLLRQSLTRLFAVFLFVLAFQWWGGEERCHCLGGLSLPLSAMAMIDALALGSLLWFRDDWQYEAIRPCGFVGDQFGNLRVVLPALLLIGISWFGSLDAARAYFSGDTVLVDSFSKFAGKVRQNEYVDVSYTLSNPTSSPVRVLGAKASCSCIAILDLPTTVEPGSTKEIRLRVTGRNADSLQRERAELFFDDSALRVVLNATAIVRPNH